ncbi:T9SS type A sorting domain-containing protein, partial [bacterium]|nr:T9SS type A sorting domain-containing protein [bacterium]
QGGYRLEDGRMPAVVMPGEGGRLISLSFDGFFDVGWHTLQLRELRDAQGSLLPADESPVVFEVIAASNEYPRLLANSIADGVRATSVELTFSEAMSPSVLQVVNYTMNHPRRVVAVDSLSTIRDRVRLHLDGRYPIGALGIVDTLWLSNITSDSGVLLNGTGSAWILLADTVSTISDAYVYPNPYRGIGPDGRGEGVMFAGLPEKATIRIFTLQGVQVRKIEHMNLIGGTIWDLTNETGNKIASGVYLYTIEAGDEKVRGKLAVTR